MCSYFYFQFFASITSHQILSIFMLHCQTWVCYSMFFSCIFLAFSQWPIARTVEELIEWENENMQTTKRSIIHGLESIHIFASTLRENLIQFYILGGGMAFQTKFAQYFSFPWLQKRYFLTFNAAVGAMLSACFASVVCTNSGQRATQFTSQTIAKTNAISIAGHRVWQ